MYLVYYSFHNHQLQNHNHYLFLAGGTAPNGWLLCDGSAVNRTTYSNLFAVISTTYGNGNGSTTFNLPDMRGRAPIGVGHGSGLSNRTRGTRGGAETHTLTVGEMPSHNHVTHANGAFEGGYLSRANTSMSGGGGWNFGGSWNIDWGMQTGHAGNGWAHNNMQPFIALNFIIKF
jgi:microcystin-dependent protein